MSDESWVFVPTQKTRLVRPERPSRVGKTAKSRVHKNAIMAILRNPPEEYDGSNKKLAEMLSMSTRQVSRLLKQLEADGKIKLTYTLNRLATGGVYTTRFIQILKENA